MTSRRDVLKGLILSLGGAMALSACGGTATVLATAPGSAGRFYTQRELALVSRLCDLIIPRTETPGALDVNVPGYLDGLMADWASEATRRSQRRSLATIDRELNRRAGGDFLAADQPAAEQALVELDARAFRRSGSLEGYRNLKGYITQSFFATEGGAVQELRWVAVPGRWDPAVEVGSS